MRKYQVEVDDEVFQYVKAHAEPLVDTFNSTLRRLLPITGKKGPTVMSFGGNNSHPYGGLPALPNRIPQALRQILEVVHLVINGPFDRSSATHYVARHHGGKAPQTIIDKYTRQLNLTASEFDRLLDQPGLTDLRKHLNSKFPDYTQLIEEIIAQGPK